MTDTDKEQFEIERIAAIRTFEIRTVDGAGRYVTEQHFAHFHNADDAGNLSLVVIESDGQQLIRHLFAAGSWSRLTEIGQAAKRLDGSAAKVH